MDREHPDVNAPDEATVWKTETDRLLQRLRVQPTAPLSSSSDACAAGLQQLLREEAPGLDGVAFELAGLGPCTAPSLAAVLRAVTLSGVVCRRIDLSGSHLQDDGAAELADFVAHQAAALEEVILRDNAVTALGLARLCCAFAGQQAYPRLDDANGLCAPCRLDLRGNAVDRPSEVLEVLGDRGIVVCLGDKCSRRRCLAASPVHLVGGLSGQVRTVRRTRDELLGLLGGPLVLPRRVRRPLAAEAWLPPPPCKAELQPSAGRPPRGSGGPPSLFPPVLENPPSDAASPPVVPLAGSYSASPMALPDISPCFDVGQHVQIRSQAESPADETFVVLSSSALALWTTGQVHVSMPAWAPVEDLMLSPCGPRDGAR